MWFFSSPNVIVFGEDALDYLEEVKGERIFIVTGRVVTKLGLLDAVLEHLKNTGMEIRIFDEVEPEPSIHTIEKGTEAIREFEPDWILGFGGGSNMDAAKVMWVLYERPDLTVEDVNPLTRLDLRKKARLITIPTTSGTGADVNWAAIITDTEKKIKLELASREIVPDIAILDPFLVTNLSPELTADTGMDALVHAIEAYTAAWKNDFSDAYALRAISLISKYIVRAYQNGRIDSEAREKMHNAASMSGMAFGNSQAGLVHAMAHSIGPLFNISHGRCVALCLKYVMQYNLKKATQPYSEIAESIGICSGTEETRARELIDMIGDLKKKIGEPSSVGELGIPREEFVAALDKLATRVNESSCTTTSCRVPSEEDTRRLFLYMYDGKSVDF
jgi:alcohol dehydrogenase class IV